ncbi:hypothetical protein BGZ82_001291 [Podila clonocystis]|nr:hypothetical protein BGZ82_001291 [Podila clonocystis]
MHHSQHTSYLQNPFYFMHASLIEKDSRAEVNLIKDDQDMDKDKGSGMVEWEGERGRDRDRDRDRERERETSDSLLLKDSRTKATTGSCVSSLYPLKDFEDSGNESGFFVFPDLSVRMEGSYRLKFCLYEMTGTQVNFCASIVSAPLVVYSAKKFPGMEESTTLSQFFAEQGLKIRIRKEVRPKKRARAGYTRDVTFETPKQAKDYDPSESTEDDESRAVDRTSKRIAVPSDAHWRDKLIPSIPRSCHREVNLPQLKTGLAHIHKQQLARTPPIGAQTSSGIIPGILGVNLLGAVQISVQTMIQITLLHHLILAVMDVHCTIAQEGTDTTEHQGRIQQTSDGLHVTCTQATITFTTHRLEATQIPTYDGSTHDTDPIHLLGVLSLTRTYRQSSLPKVWFLTHTHPTFVLFMTRTRHILLHLIPRLVDEHQEGRIFILVFRTQSHTHHPIKTWTSNTTIRTIHTVLLANLPPEIRPPRRHLPNLPVELIHILLILTAIHLILLTTCPEGTIQKMKKYILLDLHPPRDEEEHKMTDATLSALQVSTFRSSHLQYNAKDQDQDQDLDQD